jgi:site-specific DNA recombinase
MVGIYCRVSTDGQIDNTSLDGQEEAGRRFAGPEAHKVYRDEGISGGTFNRPKFEELMDDIRQGQIDKLWVLDFDRLSRARPGELDNLFIFLEENDVKLFVGGVYQPLDDPEQMLSPYLAGILAYIERIKIKKRTKRGKTNAKNLGNATFSQAYGYRQKLVNGAKEWEVVPEEENIIKEIYDLYLKGKSQREIEFVMKSKKAPLRTGQWNRTVISRILTKPFYSGQTKNVAGKMIPATRIPSIVTVEDWDKVQEIAASRNCKLVDRRVGQKPILYSHSGIVKCGDCGKSWIHKMKINVAYYSCQHDPGCSQKRSYIRREVIETIINYDVTQYLMSYYEIEKILSKQIRDAKSRQEHDITIVQSLEANLVKQNAKKKRIVGSIAEGILSPSDAKDIMAEINKNVESTKLQIKEIQTRMAKEIEDAELMLAKFSNETVNEFNKVSAASEIYGGQYENEQNTFLRKYIKQATISGDILELVFITGKLVKRWIPRKIVDWIPSQ